MRRQRDPLYVVWGAMIQRCTNPRNKQFKDYGGRGIFVCDRWRSFAHFAADMGPRPSGFTLERIDNNRGYEPRNCRWATRTEQNSNKRNCIYLVVHNGVRLTLREYCRRHSLRYRPIVKRIQDRGWPLEMAVQIPVSKSRNHNDALTLWDENEQLRDYLRVALNAAEGRPVPDSILDEARRLSESVMDVRASA